MSRYTEANCKICRRNGEKLYLKGERCSTAKCALLKRNSPPGPHIKAAKKISEYGRRLQEKQKLRFYYGVTEEKMGFLFEKARKQKGMTGSNMLSFFERRLDNILYRTHLAASRKQARQMILHGHFLVNQKKVDVPSYVAKAGDEITIKASSKERLSKRLEELKEKSMPSWLAFEEKNQAVKILHLPLREEIDVPVEEQLIVEFYSR